MAVNNLPTPDDTNLQRTAAAVKQLAQGRSNATGTVTLTANAATTTVSDVNCASTSGVWFTPSTANASAEIGNGTMRLSAVANGSFTITHANNAQVDRTFYYVIQG
jgi:hypothetical protein